MKKYLLLLVLGFYVSLTKMYSQACLLGQNQLKIVIIPDNYPSETSWNLKDQTGAIVLSGIINSDSICVPNNSCYTFTIIDSYGDGICCAFGNGSYKIYLNGVQVATGGQFTYQQSVDINCPPGTSCTTALSITTGNFTAPAQNTWYVFNPTANGMYEISTCDSSNCNTTIWVYDHCGGQVSNTNTGTIYFNDGNAGCGQWGLITAALDSTLTYYIRIGGDISCANSSILWSLTYTGPITGCLDVNACNFNPLASVSDSSCIYYPNPLCGGPDLLVVASDFENSLSIGNQSSSACSVQEGCLTGYGNRTVINFTTHIKNIGTTDYFIGNPANNPSQFNLVNCHGHPHYEGYAEYVLFDAGGQNLPIGFKNGFCVLDLECSGGGTAQYGCGNMGISKGCGDIYGSGLQCQWIDITDVDTGAYILAIKVNWNQHPDALGRTELTYSNNWAQSCIHITKDALGNKNFTVDANCLPYVDCAGVAYGNAQKDCNGNCNGTAKMGDLNSNLNQEIVDAQQYVTEILNNSITPTSCNDLNADSAITVWDASLLQNCVNHGNLNNSTCSFPRGLTNINQTTHLKIDSLNTTQGFIEVSIFSAFADINAYEFDIHGIQILNVTSLVNLIDYPVVPDFLFGNNKIIGISYVDSSIARQTGYHKLCRIYYQTITDTMICISQIVDIVNNQHEATLHQIDGPCLNVSANVGINGVDSKNYFIVYPNPSNGKLNINLNLEGTKGLLIVTDVMGKTVYSQVLSLSQKNNELDLSTLAEGVYTITLKGEKVTLSKRLVLNK